MRGEEGRKRESESETAKRQIDSGPACDHGNGEASTKLPLDDALNARTSHATQKKAFAAHFCLGRIELLESFVTCYAPGNT